MKLGRRGSGVLLHPTSLPGPFGIGDIGPGAARFAERLAECGQSWWQMLPIGPAGAGASPYSALSCFAGNPWLVSPQALSPAEPGPAEPSGSRVDFAKAQSLKRAAFERAFRAAGREDAAFRERNEAWLEDYALFAALRRAHGGAPWTSWDPELRRREPAALARARRALDEELRLERFVQREFDRQWTALRALCAEKGIGLIGDVPLFVSHDSADVWAHAELFQLGADGRPTAVAGVPPDYFSETGQRWGNPLYRWDALRARGYDWWIERFRQAFARFDAVRLDHFIGFHNYWEIPADSETAERGRWLPGPGAELFEKAREALGPVQFIAEDLGVVTDGVRALRDGLGFPGLKVLHFAFGADPETEGLDVPKRCVVYTGTHDNDTTAGWFADPKRGRERDAALRAVGTDGREFHWDLVRLALMSAADTAIIPMQDLLGLGSEARMNVPATAEGNWLWRMRDGEFTDEIAARLSRLTRESGRWRAGARS